MDKPPPLENERIRQDRDPPGYIASARERAWCWYFWMVIGVGVVVIAWACKSAY